MLTYLGKDGYGLWSAFTGLLGYFSLLNFGFQTATAKYTAEYRVLGKYSELNKIISTIFVLFAVIAVILSIFSIAISFFLPALFNAPQELIRPGSITFMLLGLGVAVRILGGIFGNIIYGHERIDLVKGFGIVQTFAYGILVIIFLMSGLDIIGIGLAFFISALILGLLYLTHIQRNNYLITISPRLYDSSTLKQIAPYSLRSFLLNLTSRLLYQTDSIVIAIFRGATSVSSYAVAYNLIFSMTYLASAISETIFPRFSSLYAQGRINDLTKIFIASTKLSTGIGVFIALFIIIDGPLFLTIWVGSENTIDSNTLLILALMSIIHTVFTPAGLLLQGIGENKGFAISEICNAGLNIVLSILLVTNHGVWGVAMGTLVAHICTSTWIVPILVSKYTNQTIKQYLLKPVIVPILLGLPTYILTQLLQDLINFTNGWAELMATATCLILVYGTFFIIIGLNQEERKEYLNFIKNRS
jgi:O-antigen/teichoic acid export membrane protein